VLHSYESKKGRKGEREERREGGRQTIPLHLTLEVFNQVLYTSFLNVAESILYCARKTV